MVQAVEVLAAANLEIPVVEIKEFEVVKKMEDEGFRLR